MKKCQRDPYCTAYIENPRSGCHEYCIGRIQMNNVYAMSNMPKRFQLQGLLEAGKDRDAFVFLRDWQNNVTEHIKDGDGLFIISETKGNGKTSWACKIMSEHFKRVALKNNLRCRGVFVNVPQFFQDLKNSFDNPSDEFYEFMENIRKAELVVWDDIGTETPTRFVRDTLYTFINYRYAEMKSQIFTSNVSLDQMKSEDWLGERTVSRIVGSCETIRFSGHDRRMSDD